MPKDLQELSQCFFDRKSQLGLAEVHRLIRLQHAELELFQRTMKYILEEYVWDPQQEEWPSDCVVDDAKELAGIS
jgi:hypothetical protein